MVSAAGGHRHPHTAPPAHAPTNQRDRFARSRPREFLKRSRTPSAPPTPRRSNTPSQPPTNQQRLICKYHPNSTNHTTEECRFGNHLTRRDAQRTPPGRNGQPPPTSTPSSTPSTMPSSSSKINVTCFACGAKGHYPSDPQCPKYAERKKRMSSGPRARSVKRAKKDSKKDATSRTHQKANADGGSASP